jgi:hypothetical protein
MFADEAWKDLDDTRCDSGEDVLMEVRRMVEGRRRKVGFLRRGSIMASEMCWWGTVGSKVGRRQGDRGGCGN